VVLLVELIGLVNFIVASFPIYTVGGAVLFRRCGRDAFVLKGLEDSARGFYEAELVKAALQKRIFLKFCAFGLRSGDKTPTTGSLVLN
jgi:hypothetical protein